MGFITLINKTTAFPIGLAIYNFKESDGKYHDDIELLMILDGTASLQIRGESYLMKPEDVVLINSNEYHLVTKSTGNALSLTFPLRFFYDETGSVRFLLNSCGDTENSKYDDVRRILSQLVKTNADAFNKYETLSLMFSLVGILLDKYILSEPNYSTSASAHITGIMDFIEKNYRKGLTLDYVADHFHLNYSYLSSTFKKATGMSFLRFYNNVRLSHALQDLIRTDQTVERIAKTNGFTDTRSFNAVFKRSYGVLPSEYRKATNVPLGYRDNQLKYDYSQYETIVKYTSLDHGSIQQRAQDNSIPLSVTVPPVSYKEAGTPLKHKYRKVLNISGCRSILYKDIQDMIRQAQKEIHYEYATLKGIFSDDMMVYAEDEHRNPHFSFIMIDKVIDFLLSVDLKPFISLSFMPAMLASDPSKTVKMGRYNVSPPKDMNKWIRLINSFFTHITDKYGKSTIESWLYTVWCQADSGTAFYQWNDSLQFFRFYKSTLEAIKTFNNKIKVGSPSMILFEQEGGFVDDYLQFISRENCAPDFITVHYFDTNFYVKEVSLKHRNKIITENDIDKIEKLNNDPLGFTKYIRSIKKKCKSFGLGAIPIYLTEWNLTVSQRNYLNDTCFKPCYLVKNILTNYDALESFGSRTLTDLNDEYFIPERLFHGGVGSFTYNGIPKSQYYAFRMMSFLGDHKLADGTGYFVSKGDTGQLLIILYNYEHYSSFATKSFNIHEKRNSRYEVFSGRRSVMMNISVSDIDALSCTAYSVYINQNRGNAYDIWVKMNRPAFYDEIEMLSLKEQSIPGEEVNTYPIENGVLKLSYKLEPLEVRLIHVRFGK